MNNLPHIIREHAKFVANRCEDGEAVAADMRLAADKIDRLREELAWCHFEMGKLWHSIHRGDVPTPDWGTKYEKDAAEAAEAAGEE